MSRFLISSRCECQASLSAILDENRHVVSGWATRGRAASGDAAAKERAPAHSINAHLERFDVGWMCPFCGRNTLRTFYAGALKRAPEPEVKPPPAEAAAGSSS
jgi:hypothetical protein